MKPAPFEYHAPTSIGAIASLLSEYGDDARPLAGGQSLVPLLNMRIVQPTALIDLSRCAELGKIGREGDRIIFGAMVRQAEAEESRLVREHCPLLAAALPHLGGAAHRNRGTVCGSLAHADPLAELPSVAMALDAEFELRSASGTRRVPASAFFVSDLTTCIEAGEFLAAVMFPCAEPGTGAAFLEVGNRGHGFALTGAAVQVTLSAGGACDDVRLAAMGAGPTPIRLAAAEDVLRSKVPTPELIREAASCAASNVTPRTDLHASADYRRQALRALVERALERALDGARETRGE